MVANIGMKNRMKFRLSKQSKVIYLSQIQARYNLGIRLLSWGGG